MELDIGIGERALPTRQLRRLSPEQQRMRNRMERLRIICAGDDRAAIKRFVKWLEIGYSTWVGMENETNWRPISSQVEERILLKLRNYGLHDVLCLRWGMTDLVDGWFAEKLGLRPRSGNFPPPPDLPMIQKKHA